MGLLPFGSSIPLAPDFTIYRSSIVGADNLALVKLPQGMTSTPWEDIWANIQVVGGSAVSLNIECVMWSELDQLFVSVAPTPMKLTTIAASCLAKFNVGGQRVFLGVSGTFGGATVNIALAGASPVQQQNA